MNQVIRGSRKIVIKQSNQHIQTLFECFKLNHQAQTEDNDCITYTPQMIQVCTFYNFSTTNNTGILYTIIGIHSRLAIIETIKSRSTFKKIKNQYRKLIERLNPDFPHWHIFSDCQQHPVTYKNSNVSRSLLNGLVPDINLNCGESTSKLYNKYFHLSHFKAELNGIHIDLMYHELIQYLTGCILPFKEAKSYTIKSSWLNQEYFRSTDTFIYLVLLTNKSERFYKIGITTKEKMSYRLNEIPYNSKVILLFKRSLMNAVWTEEKLHKLNAAYSYEPELSFAGEQECYTQVSKQSFKEVGLIEKETQSSRVWYEQ